MVRDSRWYVSGLLVGLLALVQGCGADANGSKKPAARVPAMTLEIYNGLGGGLRLAADTESVNNCHLRSPNLGSPDGTPSQDHVCTLPERDVSEAVKTTCPCAAICLQPYFDHNKNRTPPYTVQMYTPPASRRYYPGVPSAKHWENGVTTNIFTYEIQLTNNYPFALTNVAIVVVAIEPDEGRVGFQDARPNACFNDRYAVWTFGNIAPGQTVTRTAKLRLPNDDPFKITGFVASLDCPGHDNLSDTDGDGLDNATEIAAGLDPNKPDTDGDGLFDGSETNTGVFVSVWETGTDPRRRDTDGDCFGDGTEIAEGTDPLRAESHPDRRCNHADQVNPKP